LGRGHPHHRSGHLIGFLLILINRLPHGELRLHGLRTQQSAYCLITKSFLKL
jgi:hypothetical protein